MSYKKKVKRVLCVILTSEDCDLDIRNIIKGSSFLKVKVFVVSLERSISLNCVSLN